MYILAKTPDSEISPKWLQLPTLISSPQHRLLSTQLQYPLMIRTVLAALRHPHSPDSSAGAPTVSTFVHSSSSVAANEEDNGGRNSLHEHYDYYDSPAIGGFGNRVLSETNLYIRGLGDECTDDRLRQMCLKFGKIVSTKAILDKNTKKCKGYGFVDFDSSEAARAAIDGLEKEGISAQMAKDPTNLYIANLPPEYDEEKLTELLRKFGMVISSRVLRNPDGSSRGVGFCRMGSTDACTSIIAEYHGKKLSPATQAQLIVKLADSSSRKFKRSTPSLRSVYSESGYKSKGGVTPLMTTPLIDPPTYQFGALPNPSSHYGTAFYNSEMLGQQLNQMTLVANGQQQQDTVAQQHPFFFNPYNPYLNVSYQYLSPQHPYAAVVLQQQLQHDYSLATEQQHTQHSQIAQFQHPSNSVTHCSFHNRNNNSIMCNLFVSALSLQIRMLAPIPPSAVHPNAQQQQQMTTVPSSQVVWHQQQVQQAQHHQQQTSRHQQSAQTAQQLPPPSMGQSF
uniref:RRM domain-containing protein n=1 Tax=Globodera pallida TaxID=36090 RepID=A0A183CA70_GLOPA